MASQPPVMDETTETPEAAAQPVAPARKLKREKTPRPPLRQVLRELNWFMLLTVGIGTGVLWVALLIQNPTVQLLAGLLPVTAGIIVGRRIKTHTNWHAVLLGLITAVAALIGVLVLIGIQGATQPLITAGLFAFVTLIPFPAFGVITSARSEQRQREAREVQQRRGGKLDKPGRVRTIEDLRALSLPQLGGYVADLFRKHGFLINDYRFEKDRLDFQVSYEDEPWLLRVSTAEKVKSGVAQELAQRMKSEGVKKGVVITSMEFQDGVARWAKDKPVVLLDGPTLLTMDD